MGNPVSIGAGHAFLAEASAGSGDGLLLTHGAGSNCNSALLIAVAEAFLQSGVTVLRCDLAFRHKRPFGPPGRFDAASDRAGLKQSSLLLRERIDGRLFLGGHSYGGRQASILASEEPACCDALLLLSYPLHPPNKPDEPRTAHFPGVTVPALFVLGDKDQFGAPEEQRRAADLIPARTRLAILKNTGHDLARGRFDIANRVVKPFLDLIA